MFQRLSEQIGATLEADGVTEQEVLDDFAATVADADVVLSALIGGRPAS